MTTTASESAPRTHHVLRWILIAIVGIAVGCLVARIIVVVSQPTPAATVTPLLDSVVSVPGHAPTPTWPTTGEAAIAIPGLKVAEQSPAQASVPIGSITKLMTAYVLLKDHPLAIGQEGPSITVTPSDVAAWRTDLATDQSNVAIAAGEVLTERQLLEGLLVHSGNDFAQLVAEFDAGSIPAFVTKMNAQAAAIGLAGTSYGDASGFSPSSRSTPADQLRLAALALQDPVLAATVKLPSVTLPVAGTVSSYTPFVGMDGVIGVKSGLTDQAGGCDVLAIDPVIGGTHVLVLAAVTGQQGPAKLAVAGGTAFGLAVRAAETVRVVHVAGTAAPVASIGWRGSGSPIFAARAVVAPGWPGSSIHVKTVVATAIRRRVPAATTIGSVEVTSGDLITITPAALGATMVPPSFVDRVV